MYYKWLITWHLSKGSNVLMVFITPPMSTHEAHRLMDQVSKLGGYDVLIEPLLPAKFRHSADLYR